MIQALYKTVQKLTSDEQEANRLYNKLYLKTYGEEPPGDEEPLENRETCSFVDKDLSALAESVSYGESEGIDKALNKLSAYKEMFLFLHGSLTGAFDSKDTPEEQGEAYSEEVKQFLGEVSMDNPTLKGYLLGIARNPKVETPYPLDFELTDSDSLEEVVLLSDPHVVQSIIPCQEQEEEDDSSLNILECLSNSQVESLSEQVESFDSCSNHVEIDLPTYLNSSIRSYHANLSEEEVASLSLSNLLLSRKLTQGQPIPLSLLEEELKDIKEEEKPLFGGSLGYRYLVSKLRQRPTPKDENSTSTIKEDNPTTNSKEENSTSKEERVDPASLEMFVDPEEEKEALTESETYKLSEDSSHVLKVSGFKVLGSLEKEGKKIVRVPIAVLGEWYHPEYKKVTFSQQDFDDMVRNFQNREAGYEPPLFVGHENPRNKRLGGQPAVGYLQGLFQEDNVLLGDFEMVDDLVYDDIKEGKFRYASAEYAKDAVSKETAKKMGTFLAGSALTNRPHLTGMPRVQALSESNPGEITFDISQGDFMPEQETTNKEQDNSGQLSDSQFQEFRDLTKRIEQLEEQLNQKDQRIEQLETAHNKSKKEQKLGKLEQLTLSEDTKSKYRDMVNNDRLSDDQFDEVYEMLAEVASTQLQQLTSQVGSTSETTEENKEASESSGGSSDDSSDPYGNIITRNYELIEKRKKAKQEQLYSV